MLTQELQGTPWTAGDIRTEVAKMYSKVAITPSGSFRFPVGPNLARALGYPEDLLSTLPRSVTESFTDVACPVSTADLAPGEAVLDLGSGAGLDAIIAARRVGPSGRVVGVDLSEAMVAKARANAAAVGAVNVEFRLGYAEAIPTEAGTFDAVIVNGLLNLAPEKAAVVREIFRVLRPRGRAVVAEIVTDGTPPVVTLKTLDDWFR
jgi:arsenite methyltransferase